MRLIVKADEDDGKNAIIEITAGVGGAEACLFAGELYSMYDKYAKSKGWTVEDLYWSEGKQGGIRAITFQVEGPGAFGQLRYESGIHRVQRFSETASTDIMHTSAAAVVVLPETRKVEVVIRREDVRRDTFCSGGPGGQHQNKTESGIRLTHLPTNIVVSLRDGKSQTRNEERAWKLLASRISDHFLELETKSHDDNRRKLRGRGSRCEKIRTYNFPQDRVTDHRIEQSTHGIEKFMGGSIEPMIERLKAYDASE